MFATTVSGFHFIFNSKPRVSDVGMAHKRSIGAALNKGTHQCFKSENKASRPAPRPHRLQVSTPCRIVRVSPALRPFINRGRRVWHRKHAQPPHVSLEFKKKYLAISENAGFFGGGFAPTQSCLRSCSRRNAGCEDLIKQPFSSSKARMHYNLFSPFYCTVIFPRYIFFFLVF